jgi:hypothetical protein
MFDGKGQLILEGFDYGELDQERPPSLHYRLLWLTSAACFCHKVNSESVQAFAKETHSRPRAAVIDLQPARTPGWELGEVSVCPG